MKTACQIRCTACGKLFRVELNPEDLKKMKVGASRQTCPGCKPKKSK